MQYEELIELLGDYCENNIPISPNSFFNTVEEMFDNKVISIKKTSKDLIQILRTANSQTIERNLIYYVHNGIYTRGLCINIYNTAESKSNSILISLKNDEVKILLISQAAYSGFLLYLNEIEPKEEYV